MAWGDWGEESACEHLKALREFIVASGIGIWAEHSEQPRGWVNVYCEKCKRTYEVTLREPFED